MVSDTHGEGPPVTPLRVGEWATSHYDVILSVLISIAVFVTAFSALPTPPLIHDAYSYTMAAQRLVRDGYLAYAGGELPGADIPADARVTPGYILFLAAFYALRGDALDPILASQSVQPVILGFQLCLSFVTVGVLALCGRQLGGRRLGLITGLLGAAYLPFAWNARIALSESLATPLMAVQLLWALRLTAKGSARSAWSFAGFGALTAAIVLVRPSTVLWVVAVPLYAMATRLTSWKRIAFGAACALVGFTVIMAPWWIRNAVVLRAWVPLETDIVRLPDGTTANIGTAPPPTRTTAEMAERALSLAYTPWSGPFEVLWENKFHYDDLRVDYGPYPESLQPQMWAGIQFMRIYQGMLAIAAALSLAFVRRSPRLLLVATVPVYTIAVHFSTQVNPRYAFLATPALIVLAGAGAYGAWHAGAALMRRTSASVVG